MRQLPTLLLFVTLCVALFLPLRPPVVSAQLEQTPILGEPVMVTPLISAVPVIEPSPDSTATPTAAAGAGNPTTSTDNAAVVADTCEPNNTPARPCPLPLDAISGPFTIVPESDQDFFGLDLPEEPSIQTIITVRATAGLDLALSVRQGERLIATGTLSLTLAPSITGSVVLRVENRDPRPATNEQYRVEVRREIVPPSLQSPATPTTLVPDALENNWSFQTAAPIAGGVVYDLSFVCPDLRPDACPGGDHDYLLVPVKAGVTYLLATFDLDPGVDTVVELFWGSTTAPATGNDDFAPGGALSALVWTAPGDGLLGVRIAPRNGGLSQHLAEPSRGYRFAVAPAASELARKLQATIRQQANLPTPTPTAVAPTATTGAAGTSGSGTMTGGGAPATPAGSTAPQETIASGSAIIVHETVLRREPSERSTALATLPAEQPVIVRGPVSGLWVSVESDASILPGWVRWSDLQRVDANATTTTPDRSMTASPSSATASSATTLPEPPAPSTASEPVEQPAARADRVVITALDPTLPLPPPQPVARVPFALSVTVVATDRPPTGGSALGFATPTPDMRQPLAGVRIQLLNVFGDLLAEGLTDGRGVVTLSRDIRPGDALLVRLPAWGVELPLAADQSNLIVTAPEARP